jgi:NADP-dependent 3-hydroxy acid dehydrogenase YdfG
MQLKDKVALVTGASSGIGKAAAHLFAQEGARVALLGRTEKDIKQTAEEFSRLGYEALPLVADISQPQEMEQAVKKITGQWKRLDIVLANAGINGVWTSLEELTPEDWDQTLGINLKGTFLTVKLKTLTCQSRLLT